MEMFLHIKRLVLGVDQENLKGKRRKMRLQKFIHSAALNVRVKEIVRMNKQLVRTN